MICKPKDREKCVDAPQLIIVYYIHITGDENRKSKKSGTDHENYQIKVTSSILNPKFLNVSVKSAVA